MLKVEALPVPEKLEGHDRAFVEAKFVNSFRDLSQHIFAVNSEKGFWKDGVDRNQSEMIALVHSELSEALEALRKNPRAPDEKVPLFTNLECEFADAVVRIMDIGHGLGLDIAGALIHKVRFNESRPFMHGKSF